MGLKVFLSYGHDANAPLVHRIKADLEAAGHQPWIDTAEIKAGEDWRREILAGITASDCVLAFLSKHSINDSGVCPDELPIALDETLLQCCRRRIMAHAVHRDRRTALPGGTMWSP